uniref:Core-2/I-Branching enzyme n=1 Tax=viral metagenome TaxID=1070528 RepID=A0A6C0LLI1_9ZZZZ
MNKIAFLFLIYDMINHENIWHRYFRDFHNFEGGVRKSQYNIYIHYKTDVRLEFFDEYKIHKSKIIDTKYADISIVKAQNILIKEALKDAKNTHFIFLSGSCIPLKSFDYLYHYLEPKYSYFHVADPDDCFPDCEVALQYIPKRHIHKASQWCILNRKHAELLTDGTASSNTYLRWFEDTYAPDELCYISYLSYIYNDTLDDEIIATSYHSPPEVATTFANWEDMNYKYVSERELKNYKSISEEELVHLLRSKSLFGRKFKPSCYPSLNKKIYYDTIG